ncbi:cop9 signalosome complex subunit 12 [Grosmannia clavigera kw1407]|uniref:Cop9 signalosome complex subunit 12 n=1 Tax=Grosmannia clavigera (strain kw1407 / UAMH 11150) TaxID=655863 RepID=F0XFW4_GROCL|nr:cop9 signalosome complex subunit 12 [Grosmannia clavigera kw1407]EFX03460.1 cop9 signalosome complex subunit 12 [Grosmannia clavigera kw1407]
MSLATQFLTSIRGFVSRQDGAALRDWLQVDRGASPQYWTLAQELRVGFRDDAAVSSLVDRCLPTDEDDGSEGGVPWPGLVAFVRDYMLYWRGVDFDDLPALHVLLSGLLTSAATALSHPTHGTLMLETGVAVAESLARLVMVLHRRPDLMRRMRPAGANAAAPAGGSTGDEERKSLMENTADAIQKLFTTCLIDRSSSRWSRPEGKKTAVYRLANLVLKLLFAGNKARWAVQMFTNIASTGPPLALYPAAQRVTYLYYLGRFFLENNNFARAALCLDDAYRQTPPACLRHRRLILAYLIPANMLLGRFPSDALLLRPEAADLLRPVFAPIVAAVRRGNFVAFHIALRQHEPWLFRRGLLATLAYRLRPLLWRSLARNTFILTYQPPADPDSSNNTRRPAPTLDLADLLTAATLAQHQLEGWIPVAPAPRPRPPHTNTLFLRAVANTTAENISRNPPSSTLAAPPGGPRRLRPSEGLVWGNLRVTLADVESIVASLVAQGLMHGFVAHAAAKFAVVGAKAKGSALLAGWPPVAKVLRDRLAEEGVDLLSVPAWVKAP